VAEVAHTKGQREQAEQVVAVLEIAVLVLQERQTQAVAVAAVGILVPQMRAVRVAQV